MEHDTLVVTCRRGASEQTRNALDRIPAGSGFALLTSPSESADGRLVWKPGQAGPAAITPPGSAGRYLTGTMLLVAVGMPEDDVRVHEDGFALLATEDTWQAARRALVEETALELPASASGLGLRIEHVEPGGHVPAGGVRGPEEIVLLSSELEIERAIPTARLSAYIEALIEALSPLATVELRIELAPDAAPGLEAEDLPSDVEEALRSVAVPAVESPIAFLIKKPLPT